MSGYARPTFGKLARFAHSEALPCSLRYHDFSYWRALSRGDELSLKGSATSLFSSPFLAVVVAAAAAAAAAANDDVSVNTKLSHTTTANCGCVGSGDSWTPQLSGLEPLPIPFCLILASEIAYQARADTCHQSGGEYQPGMQHYYIKANVHDIRNDTD
ncbi:hypothetical protein SprV_0401618200 [Sparganum proliferum]